VVGEWYEFAASLPPTPFFELPQLLIETDASPTGTGIWITGVVQIQVALVDADEAHINERELRAILKAVERVPRQRVPTPAALHLDNTTAMWWVGGGSTVPEVVSILRDILRGFIDRNLNLVYVRYIKSGDNTVADPLSRVQARMPGAEDPFPLFKA